MHCTEDLNMKIVSSMEKCFLDDELSKKTVLKSISGLKNEEISFQIIYKFNGDINHTPLAILKVAGELKDHISIQQVVSVPSNMPINYQSYDDDYIRTKPGLFPELITPLHYNGKVNLMGGSLGSLWVDVKLTNDIAAGEYETVFILASEDGRTFGESKILIEVIDAILPETDMYHTEWFHADCLAEYYNVDVFSDRHFEIIKNYIKTAVDNKINVIMMPVFTPALDTYIGGERLTCQLVKISRDGNRYNFDFSLMHRWIDICLECWVKYFEIPPFFSQWGAKNTPKIMAFENGNYRQIFGWETDALSDEYRTFLKLFVPALLNELVSRGIDKRTVFHISDEPDLDDFDRYSQTTSIIKQLLKDYIMIDAVWDLKIYESGVLSTPVISISEVDRFIEAGADNYWVYYCGGHNKKVSNRFFSMPSYRTRILGVQLYHYNAKGFLHWGYNFWHNRYSYDIINPFLETSGEYFAPSGDTHIVYPAQDGTPYASVRLKLLRDAFQDVAALELCERVCGREFVNSLLEEEMGCNFSFTEYPQGSQYIENLRERVNHAIAKEISNCK